MLSSLWLDLKFFILDLLATLIPEKSESGRVRPALLGQAFAGGKLERLEERVCPAVIWTVNALTDNGGANGTGNLATNAGDLRFCVVKAASGDSIVFKNGLVGTITLGSSLDVTGKNLTITGNTNLGDTITAKVGLIAFSVEKQANLTLNDISIANCDVSNNALTGAAINEDTGASVWINGCSFTGDRAVDGGAIYCRSGASLTIGAYAYMVGGIQVNAPTNFSDNYAKLDGGAIGGSDFSLTVSNYGSFKGTEFYSNNAGRYGGAISLSSLIVGTTANINSAYFTENEADYGGAVYISNFMTTVSLQNNVVDYNYAYGGAGFYIDNGFVTFSVSNQVNNNTANEDGGGFYIEAGTVNVDVTLVIANNTTMMGLGNGIYIRSITGTAVLNGAPTLTNNVIFAW